MDTVISTQKILEKRVISITGIIISFCLIFIQSSLSLAKDMAIGNYTGLSPALNGLIEKQSIKEENFNQNLLKKYSNSKIVEVEKGVKHVRMIRFYNNRPVRINIVELSTDINSNLNITPAIASDSLASRAKISNIAQREKALPIPRL